MGDAAFEGLSTAGRAAPARGIADGAPVPWRLLSDWTNSRYKATEPFHAMLRLGVAMPGVACPEAE